MPKFRKKPVVVEAEQFVNSNPTNWREWCGAEDNGNHLIIHTLEGDHRADLGDWIIKGVKGEFYTCKPDIFELTYEPVERGGSVSNKHLSVDELLELMLDAWFLRTKECVNLDDDTVTPPPTREQWKDSVRLNVQKLLLKRDRTLLTTLQTEVEGLRKHANFRAMSITEPARHYNQALNDVLAIIKKLREGK